MNLPRHKKTLTSATVIALVMLSLLVSLVAAYQWLSIRPAKTNNTADTATQERQEQKQTQSEQKQDFVENKHGVTNASPAPTPTDNSQISLATSRQSDSIIVTTQLTGFSAGACRLIVTNGTKSIVQNATILYQPEFSSCTGFSVPASSLGAGQWTLTLEVTPSGGDLLTKTITSRVE